MTITLTDDERALLRKLHDDMGELIAAPYSAIEGWRSGTYSGGGWGFHFAFEKTRVTGQWSEWHPTHFQPDGAPWRWKSGQLLRSVSITYHRLNKWVESLPTGIREQALTWWRTYPEETRDLDKLAQLVLDVLADPEPDPEPRDLLELLAAATA
ncbi:hypothetical protein [Nocardia asteroides]|uniref:hypothetical protein n=1 Tax=Nocardia asteroides TaxID=1824 RepID=UPI0033D16CEF